MCDIVRVLRAETFQEGDKSFGLSRVYEIEKLVSYESKGERELKQIYKIH